jgi:hypothetical protein
LVLGQSDSKLKLEILPSDEAGGTPEMLRGSGVCRQRPGGDVRRSGWASWLPFRAISAIFDEPTKYENVAFPFAVVMFSSRLRGSRMIVASPQCADNPPTSAR